jgi:hypothetical protein
MAEAYPACEAVSSSQGDCQDRRTEKNERPPRTSRRMALYKQIGFDGLIGESGSDASILWPGREG